MHTLTLNPLTIDSPLLEDQVNKLCKKIYYNWKNDATFGYYLLEQEPSGYQYISDDLLTALTKDPQHHILYIIRDQSMHDVGYILLKNYLPILCDDPIYQRSYLPQVPFPNVEVSYRTFQKGVCSRSLHGVLNHYITLHPHIKGFLGHHAIENKASGLVFQQNGFAGLRYHDDYVYLPNMQQYSDTIMWVLQTDQYVQDTNHYSDYLHFKKSMKANTLRTYHLPHISHEKIANWYQNIHQNVDQKSLLSSKY